MALRGKEAMDRLDVTRLWECGEEAVWETEHLFGFDVMFGQQHGRFLAPQIIICREVALTEWEWTRVRRACALRSGGDYATASAIISEVTMGNPAHRVHRPR